MIPALPGPAICHQAEQFQQVTTGTSASTRRRHRRNNRLTISNGNGRLAHGEAPGRTRICRKTPVLPELRPASAAKRHNRPSPTRRRAN